MLTINLKLDDRTKKFIKEFPDLYHKGLVDGAKDVSLHWVAKSKQASPVRTGTLRRSLVQSYDKTGKTLTIRVGSNLIYFPTVHEGATIRPVKAKMLAWQSGGKWHFAKSVTIKANPFVYRAGEQNLSAFARIFESRIKKAVEQ